MDASGLRDSISFVLSVLRDSSVHSIFEIFNSLLGLELIFQMLPFRPEPSWDSMNDESLSAEGSFRKRYYSSECHF